MTAPRVTFYFDIGSPFSYIAFHVLKNSSVFSECKIEYVPVLLRDLLQRCQNPPPIGVKNKFQWIKRERLYWARRFGIPMTEALPEGFPASTVDLQTALSIIYKESPSSIASVAEKLFYIFWAKADTSFIESAQFAPLLESELDGATLSKVLYAGPDAKALLDENTDKAFASGAFGLPWFECVNSEGIKEGFWGIDHLGRVADFLHLETSVDPSFGVVL